MSETRHPGEGGERERRGRSSVARPGGCSSQASTRRPSTSSASELPSGWVAPEPRVGRRAAALARAAGLATRSLIVLATGACSSVSTPAAVGPHAPSATSSAAADRDGGGSGGQSPAPPARTAPAMRVAARSTPGDAEHFTDPERRQKILALATSQRAELERELRALGAPGFAWGLVVDDALVLAGGEGATRVEGGAPVTPSTLFRIGSITKVFTALAVLSLRERGLVALDEPIRRWLPEFDGVVYPSADSPLITPRHILLHRSGLSRLGNFTYTDPDHPATERDVLGALDGAVLGSPPGLVFEYSNFGYGLLGQLVSRAAQQPFDEYISERVFAPLGMSHSVWSPDRAPQGLLARPHELRDGKLEVLPEWPFGASSGSGGIYSSVEDMARFVSFQLGAWPASSRRESPVLSRASLRESHGFQSLEELRAHRGRDEKVRGHARGQGVGWAVYRDCRFDLVTWHNGGTEGHMAAVYFLPHEGVGVIALANRGGVDVDSPARHVLERLHDGGVLTRREQTRELSPQWRPTVEAALALGTAFDPLKYDALFALAFRKALPADQMRAYLQQATAPLGRCTLGALVDSHHPRWVAAALQCEGGARIVEAQLLPEGTLIGFWIGDEARHRERLARRVDERGTCE